MDSSAPGFPVLHCLLEFAQTHVHPTVSSSVIPFSVYLQSFPASGSFPMSQLFISGSRSIGASASVLVVNIQRWFPLGLTGLILQESRGLSRWVFSNTIVQFSRSVVSDSLQPHGTAAHQASLSITNSLSLLKLMFIESMMSSNHLILCHPVLPPPSIFPSIRVFSNESVLHIRWPKYFSFSFSISPSNEYSGLISFRMD